MTESVSKNIAFHARVHTRQCVHASTLTLALTSMSLKLPLITNDVSNQIILILPAHATARLLLDQHGFKFFISVLLI